MNPVIRQYFDMVEVQLLHSPAVRSYLVIRHDIALLDGKLRIKAELMDGGVLECFEYVTESDGRIQLQRYSFHWQDRGGHLKQRWDNAPHYPHLPNVPHHVHDPDGLVRGVAEVPDTMTVLTTIEQTLLTNDEQ